MAADRHALINAGEMTRLVEQAVVVSLGLMDREGRTIGHDARSLRAAIQESLLTLFAAHLGDSLPVQTTDLLPWHLRREMHGGGISAVAVPPKSAPATAPVVELDPGIPGEGTAAQPERASDAEFHAWLQSEDAGRCVEVRYFDDGLRYAAIKPLLFHWTMIVGIVGDRAGFDDRWCYGDRAAAERGLRDWSGDGDPAGWNRHPKTGRRRDGGDPAREYVAA